MAQQPKQSHILATTPAMSPPAQSVLDADDRAMPQPDYLEILTNLGPGGRYFFRCQFCHMAFRLWSPPFAMRYLLAEWHEYTSDEQTRRYVQGYESARQEQEHAQRQCFWTW